MSKLEAFVEQDFAAYESSRQKDPEYNSYRLAVRRKLDAYGKAAKARLAKERGLTLASRTSLNHPYKYNYGRVNAQWAYLSRTPKDKKAIASRIGPALAKDVDTHYIQTTLVTSLDAQGFEVAFRIHALAWWEGQNLRNKMAHTPERERITEILNALPQGFILQMDTWKKEYHCGKLRPSDMETYFSYYTPGEHWLNLRRRLPKSFVVELGPTIEDFVMESHLALEPLYRFVVWTEENDFLFDEDGRIIR